MTQVKMPTGEIVEMPDNPTPEQLRALAAIQGTNQRQMASNPASAGGGVRHEPWGPAGSTLASLQSFLERGPAPDNPTVQQLARGTGLAAGALAKGVTGTAGMLSDAAVGGYNALTGSQAPLPSRQLAAQFPQPETGMEKLADFAGTAVAGGVGDPLARALQSRMPQPAPRQLTQQEDAVKMARDQGYRLTPSQAGGGTFGKIVEGIGGKKKTAEAIARYNAHADLPQPPADIAQHVSDLADHMLRRSPLTGAAFILGGPKAAGAMVAGPLLRLGARKLINSEVGQRMFVDPKVQQSLLANPALLRAYPAMIQNSPFANQ